MKIFFNPRCNTCRQALAILKESGRDPEVVEYLDHPPGADDLRHILKLLDLKPIDLIRQKEPEFDPYRGKTLDDGELIALMVKIPRLIQRPIIIEGNRALIGRPAEVVKTWL